MKKIKISLFIILYFFIATSYASVIMIKTRVVYNSDARFETLKLMNDDSIPYVMQIWADDGNSNSTPDTANAPFIVEPSIFKIAPKTGRDARLIFTGEGLPTNKESVFYLNIAQIPPINEGPGIDSMNRLNLIIRHRVKIFYRPSSITPLINDIHKKIFFYKIKNNSFEIKNESPFFVSLSRVTAKNISGEKIKYKASMIPPFSSQVITMVDNKSKTFTPTLVNYSYVNDLGGIENYEYKLK